VSLAALIAAQRDQHGIPHAIACRALGVSQAWFYKWRGGDVLLRRKRRAALAALIAYLFARHHGSYGSPRITADLRERGWRVSENTVATLMAEQHLMARRKRRRRSLTKLTGRRAKPRMRCSVTSPHHSGPTCAGAGTLRKSPPTRASSTSLRSWICTHAAAWGSRWVPTTTPS
jgi:putative transposase